jgi:hypothetical protein
MFLEEANSENTSEMAHAGQPLTLDSECRLGLYMCQSSVSTEETPSYPVATSKDGHVTYRTGLGPDKDSPPTKYFDWRRMIDDRAQDITGAAMCGERANVTYRAGLGPAEKMKHVAKSRSYFSAIPPGM